MHAKCTFSPHTLLICVVVGERAREDEISCGASTSGLRQRLMMWKEWTEKSLRINLGMCVVATLSRVSSASSHCEKATECTFPFFSLLVALVATASAFAASASVSVSVYCA